MELVIKVVIFNVLLLPFIILLKYHPLKTVCKISNLFLKISSIVIFSIIPIYIIYTLKLWTIGLISTIIVFKIIDLFLIKHELFLEKQAEMLTRKTIDAVFGSLLVLLPLLKIYPEYHSQVILVSFLVFFVMMIDYKNVSTILPMLTGALYGIIAAVISFVNRSFSYVIVSAFIWCLLISVSIVIKKRVVDTDRVDKFALVFAVLFPLVISNYDVQVLNVYSNLKNVLVIVILEFAVFILDYYFRKTNVPQLFKQFSYPLLGFGVVWLVWNRLGINQINVAMLTLHTQFLIIYFTRMLPVSNKEILSNDIINAHHDGFKYSYGSRVGDFLYKLLFGYNCTQVSVVYGVVFELILLVLAFYSRDSVNLLIEYEVLQSNLENISNFTGFISLMFYQNIFYFLMGLSDFISKYKVRDSINDNELAKLTTRVAGNYFLIPCSALLWHKSISPTLPWWLVGIAILLFISYGVAFSMFLADDVVNKSVNLRKTRIMIAHLLNVFVGTFVLSVVIFTNISYETIFLYGLAGIVISSIFSKLIGFDTLLASKNYYTSMKWKLIIDMICIIGYKVFLPVHYFIFFAITSNQNFAMKAVVIFAFQAVSFIVHYFLVRILPSTSNVEGTYIDARKFSYIKNQLMLEN